MAKTNPEWIQRAFPGALQPREQWFPVKVHRVDRTAITMEDRVKISENALEAICQENEVEGHKVQSFPMVTCPPQLFFFPVRSYVCTLLHHSHTNSGQ
jgi:hypothetical protein